MELSFSIPWILIIPAIFTSIHPVELYPDGAPSLACINLLPVHGKAPQSPESFPYDLKIGRQEKNKLRWNGTILLYK